MVTNRIVKWIKIRLGIKFLLGFSFFTPINKHPHVIFNLTSMQFLLLSKFQNLQKKRRSGQRKLKEKRNNSLRVLARGEKRVAGDLMEMKILKGKNHLCMALA